MDFREYKIKKKQLDFSRPTFNEPMAKLPRTELIGANITMMTEIEEKQQSSYADEDDSRDTDTSLASALKATIDKVSVYLRLKPTKETVPDVYAFEDETVVVRSNQLNQLTIVERQYTFTSILEQTTDQKAVYDETVRPVLTLPFASMGAVFASYGVSNSGKTYTILGEKSAGLVPRAITQIFTQYQKNIAVYPVVKVVNDKIKIQNDDEVEADVDARDSFIKESRKLHKFKLHDWAETVQNEHQFETKLPEPDYLQIYIWISFVEIYNEKMIDLFKPQKGTASTFQQNLRIISNNGHSYVSGLTWLQVSNIEDALELLQHGLRRVNYAATGLNAHSSRSHTIFTINMISECGSSCEFSSYKFCDLAGAERSSKTKNAGDRLKEAGGINTSLLVLGRCLEAVQNNQRAGHKLKKDCVPVRESKLTFLLQSSLLGKEKFVMIVNLLPTLECFEENLNVLHFGSIANKIVTRKTQARRFSRGSSCYSYFMQHAVNSPIMNSSLVHSENGLDESSLDVSYKREHMSSDELRHELRKKDLECDCLRRIVEQKEREFLQKEMELRQQGVKANEKTREAEKEFFEEKVKIMEDYHNKKLNSMKLKYDRMLGDQEEYIESLISENNILKKKLGITDDDDIIDLDDDSDDEESESSNKENSQAGAQVAQE